MVKRLMALWRSPSLANVCMINGSPSRIIWPRPEMSANPVNPRNGLFHWDHSGCQVWRPPLRLNQVPKLTSLSIRTRSPYWRSPDPWSNRLGITRLSCMSPAASRIHQRLQIGVSAVGHPHRALALVEPDLVPGQEVDPEEHGTELAEVRDVALHVLLGPVAGGVHPLQEPAAVEVVARVDDVGHLDVGPADDGHRRVGDRRPGGPQGVVVDAELEALGLQVLGPPGPVVHPVVGLAHDVAVRRDPLGVVDPAVGAHHGVAVVTEGRRHPVDVGLPHVLGDEGVR